MSTFKSFLVDVLQNHDREPRIREDGFHASMSGKCPRHVLANYMNHGTRKTYPFTNETKGVFDIGHMFDKWCKAACEEGFYSHPFLYPMVPFRTVTKIGKLKIVGEMDLMVLDLPARMIHVVDFKSIGASQFPMQRRENQPKLQHAMQVSCYMLCDAIEELKSTGWGVQGWVAYVSKDDMQIFVAKVNANFLDTTSMYWQDISDCLEQGHCPQAGDEQMMVPAEGWECGYCSMYPPIDQTKYTTKTALQQARGATRESNMRMCMTQPSELLGLPIRTKALLADNEDFENMPVDGLDGPDKMEEGDR